ncbi:hypothetical protein T4E_11493 [Trichinella pseudospiralis]|uniref:Uncharacterized protein n=1 Tax=Trichinella pseudospiralis TaxID=6337 RepID=A0A0V0XES0_TRIPS|nr:hypothetical protein T4E_11493 [Trichinella pseudospiralis]
MKILMETAFLQLYEIPAAVDLLGRNMNRQAKKHHLSSFELLQLRIDEQGSTLIQQLCITALTAEYDGGTRTIERFLKAIAYDVIELVNF